MSLVVLDAIDWDKVDWGSVPQWLAALGSVSVVLAFLVFRRDRENADRVQVDRVGAWATVAYERRAPSDSQRVEVGEVTAHVRNGSELPVRVTQVAWRIETRWLVEDRAQYQPPHPMSWTVESGTEPRRSFADDLQVPPGETKVWSFEVNVAHMAPEGAVQPHLDKGMVAHVDWLLIVDNAGRRWEVNPETGGRARRVGRRWRPKEYMPRQW